MGIPQCIIGVKSLAAGGEAIKKILPHLYPCFLYYSEAKYFRNKFINIHSRALAAHR